VAPEVIVKADGDFLTEFLNGLPFTRYQAATGTSLLEGKILKKIN
jgi:hypothetical protein